ncbi:hypothetical protein Vretimale_1271 [Volvox reticuliferus]|uniref:Uncharacterized protein n=1 Tax=Volvox reticuliferus TaxID=1737510 RepID=A0A8J4DAE7_9CHLO|nr:hypothetical protein Vretimale_1271 [Volvox reticuliferus]
MDNLPDLLKVAYENPPRPILVTPDLSNNRAIGRDLVALASLQIHHHKVAGRGVPSAKEKLSLLRVMIFIVIKVDAIQLALFEGMAGPHVGLRRDNYCQEPLFKAYPGNLYLSRT